MTRTLRFEFWRLSLERQPAGKDAGSAPTVPPNELARALLKIHQPQEARVCLERALSIAPDAKGFWLLSRAYLQEGAKTNALQRWKNPLRFGMKTLSSRSHRDSSAQSVVRNVIRRSFNLSKARGTLTRSCGPRTLVTWFQSRNPSPIRSKQT